MDQVPTRVLNITHANMDTRMCSPIMLMCMYTPITQLLDLSFFVKLCGSHFSTEGKQCEGSNLIKDIAMIGLMSFAVHLVLIGGNLLKLLAVSE